MEPPEEEHNYPLLPQNQDPKQYIHDWTEKANPKIEPYNRIIINKTLYNLLKAFVIILGIAVLIFGVLAYNGDLKDQCICEAQNFSCPDIPSCPSCPTLSCPNVQCSNVSLNCGNIIVPTNSS